MRGIHRWPVNCPYKGPVKRKKFPFDDVIMMSATFEKPIDKRLIECFFWTYLAGLVDSHRWGDTSTRLNAEYFAIYFGLTWTMGISAVFFVHAPFPSTNGGQIACRKGCARRPWESLYWIRMAGYQTFLWTNNKASPRGTFVISNEVQVGSS